MRAALYVRVSTPGQGEEDKASIPEQIARIERYCQEKGYSIVERYVDIGYSGAKSKRPEFQRMLADAKISKFDVIVCWKADRLSRGMYPAAALMEVIEPLGITIEAVEEHLDMNYFAMLAVVGKMELDNIKARTQMGREARIKKGKTHGKPPYGYSYNQHTGCFEVNEDEAKVVRQIFQLYAQGMPIRKIAARLNGSGIPTKEKTKYGWTITKITEMVSQTCYCGEAYYNKRCGATNKRKEKSKWLAMPMPSIVSRETFELAQSRKRTHKMFSPRKTKAIYLLQHILFCQECGMHFYALNRGRDRRGYICRGVQEYPHLYSCRTPKRIPADELDCLVWDKIEQTLRSPALLKLALDDRLEQLRSAMANEGRRLKAVKDDIYRCERERDWVITQARRGAITEEEMDRQLSALTEERERYETELHEVLEAREIKAKGADILNEAWQRCLQLKPRLDYLSQGKTEEAAKERQAIVRLLVNRVLVNGHGEVTIELAIPDLAKESLFDSTTLEDAMICSGSFDCPTSQHGV